MTNKHVKRKEVKTVAKEFPFICLDCERVVYLSRFRKGETQCPLCLSRALTPAVGIWLEIGQTFRDPERRERVFTFFRALLGEVSRLYGRREVVNRA